MESTERKPNRLTEYDYSQPGAYFITICSKDKRCIFSNIVGDGALDVPKTILTDIGKIVEKYIVSTNHIENIYVDRYIIMPNHIHMILVIMPAENIESRKNMVFGTSWEPSPTNQLIPHVISTLKRLCNNEIGYNVFQRSYHDHVIRHHEDYVKISKYIYENPLRWQYDCFYPK